MHHRVSRIWPKCSGQDGSSVICTSCGALVACSRAEAQWFSIHIDPCWYSTDFSIFQHGSSMFDVLGLLPVWWIAKTLFGENETNKCVLELRRFFSPHRRLIGKCGVRIWRMAIRSGKRINVQAEKMRLTPTWQFSERQVLSTAVTGGSQRCSWLLFSI